MTTLPPPDPRSLTRPIEILIVEDNPDDVELTIEALRDSKVANNIHVARDGVEALEFLRRLGPHANAVSPDLVFLDLNMPRKNGREVLEEMKADPDIKHIPVVILTTSKADEDIARTYKLQAAAYVVKPVDFHRFVAVIRAIDDFWFNAVSFVRK